MSDEEIDAHDDIMMDGAVEDARNKALDEAAKIVRDSIEFGREQKKDGFAFSALEVIEEQILRLKNV